MAETPQTLMDRLPRVGEVKWIGVRPDRRAPVELRRTVDANTERGLVGDRYAGSGGKRQVTLIQWEHLTAIAGVLGLEMVEPALLRRNVAVSGINLLALKGKRFEIGGAVLEHTGTCDPCSFVEETFGPGGYNAVRGHGGITARVVESGPIALGDAVRAVS